MKVLHIAPTPFFSDRGCHIRVLSILRAIETYGGENILCTYPLGRDLPGLDIRRTPAVDGYERTEAGPQKGKVLADLKLVMLSLRTAFKEQPDIIHAHLHEGVLIGWVVRWALIWRRTPLVADLQGGLVGELAEHDFFLRSGFFAGPLRWLFARLESITLSLPAHLFCSSGNSERIFRNDYRVRASRLTRLDDRVDLSAYDSARITAVTSPFASDVFVVIYSGSLLPIKGLDILQEVILSLTTKRRDIGFVLIGYPTETMAQFVDEHSIGGRVTLVGRVAFESLPNYLLSADAGIEPKHSASGEGSGKLLHYMAAGLALAAFPSEHNCDLAGAEALAQGHTAKSLVEQIERLADDPAECRAAGHRNRERTQPYSLQSGGKLITDVYRNLGLAP
ncbi:MAG TPA: hypothetical protein DHW07_05955 [Gammaproteobacteria bacterium]|nr:hypothetical protein [Gammaproteobacteria bacterium]